MTILELLLIPLLGPALVLLVFVSAWSRVLLSTIAYAVALLCLRDALAVLEPLVSPLVFGAACTAALWLALAPLLAAAHPLPDLPPAPSPSKEPKP